ncbi:MAG: hypothetical protein FWF29_01365 [Treponema sp.]|nr:hypothetical protein [Treponema sp.]
MMKSGRNPAVWRNPILLRSLIICAVLLLCITAAGFGQQNLPHRPPIYWTVYENNFTREKQGIQNNYIPENELRANIEWVEKELKPYGFDMVCIDGWGDWSSGDENGYRVTHSRYWEHDYAWWSAYLRERGMTLGMYDNPLWISRADAGMGKMIVGTDIPIKSLINKREWSAFGFTWVQVNRPGAEQYIKGNVYHWADIGVSFLRVDFLSWYESGWDDNQNGGQGGQTGTMFRPRADYEKALRWIREACDERGITLSLVMPNLHHEGELERKYGNMYRINEDSADGGWWRFSDNGRGIRKKNWSQFRNTFDGLVYWSRYTGPGKAMLDGDFLRLNTFANDDERKAVVSLNVIAGGAVAAADQYNTIGDSLWIWQNDELFSLSREGFIGKPLSNDPGNDPYDQIWTGQAANGDWIVAFFNREGSDRARALDFASGIGIKEGAVRDIWAHADLGVVSALVASVPPHGCRIFRITPSGGGVN